MAQHVSGLQGRAAVYALTQKTEGLLEPLLEEDESSSSSSSESSQYSMSSSAASSITIEAKQSVLQKLKRFVGKFSAVADIGIAPYFLYILMFANSI